MKQYSVKRIGLVDLKTRELRPKLYLRKERQSLRRWLREGEEPVKVVEVVVTYRA